MNNTAYHHRCQESQKHKALQFQTIIGQLPPSIQSIIFIRKQILRNLLQHNQKLLFDMQIRKTEISTIQQKILQLQEKEFHKKRLEDKERTVQTQYDDLQRLSVKLARDIKLLNDQEQIKRGKAIIQYNKIKEIKQEQETQRKKKDILERQLEQIKKNSEALRKKLKIIKEDKRKKSVNKEKLDEGHLKNQVKQLQVELIQANNHIARINSEKQNYFSIEELHRAEKQLEKLKKQSIKYDQLQGINSKLHEERELLQQRIYLLKDVDGDFVSEKKMMCQELKQKYASLESQKRQYQTLLQLNHQKLNALTTQYPQLLEAKKKIKRKKGWKSKHEKEEIQKLQIQNCKQTEVQELELKPYKWKISNKMRHLFWKISIMLLVLGLFLSSLNGLLFS